MNNICIILLVALVVVWLIYRSNKSNMTDKPKHLLSFQTTFVLGENIKWLDEFLTYYNHIGFDHFYLYDNEGSVGADYAHGHTIGKNKSGFKIESYNTKEDTQLLNDILKKYNNITYVKWQPRDKNGNIWYGQKEAFEHCIKTYGHETEWLALMDLDEFIFSKNNINIREFFANQPRDVSCITLVQQKFIDKFLTNERFVTQDYRTMSYEPGLEWSPKNIIRPQDYIDGIIHTFKVKGKTIVVPRDILRFNHYNMNDWQFKKMNERFNKKLWTMDRYDDSMKRYRHLF